MQAVYSPLAGHEDLNDALRVAADPTFRLLGSKQNRDRGGADLLAAELRDGACSQATRI